MSPEPVLEIEGIAFRYGAGYGRSSAESLFIAKSPELTSDYLDVLRGAMGGNIVELGIFQGGSAGLAALVAKPNRLVVVDLCEPLAELDQFIVDHELGTVLHPHYGIDQGDRDLVTRIAVDEFGDEQLDLVIDDASHLYGPTRTSFEVLFPRLRPGGRFLVEDWHWELQVLHASVADELIDPLISDASKVLADADQPNYDLTSSSLARFGRDDTGPTSQAIRRRVDAAGIDPVDTGYRALAQLGVELVTLAAVRPDIVARVSFDRWWIDVERGPAALPLDGFDLTAEGRDVSRLITP